MRTVPGRGSSAIEPRALRRALFAAGIGSAACLGALHFADLADHARAGAWLPLLGGALSGLLAADFASGVVHWACDTWGDARTRWVGPGLIASFREHHRDPDAMLDHDWVEVNGEVAVAAALAFAIALLPLPQAFLRESAFASAFAWAAIGCGALANQVHQWAHRPEPPAAVRALQRVGAILSRQRHAAHHRAPNTRAYCIATGWSNALLDAVGFWRWLERGIARVAGAEPRRNEPAGSDSLRA